LVTACGFSFVNLRCAAIAVLLGARTTIPITFFVELRTKLTLDARFFQPRHDGVLIAGETVHSLLWRCLSGDRLGDVLPPELNQATDPGRYCRQLQSWGPELRYRGG
jgi:hypothetical protein